MRRLLYLWVLLATSVLAQNADFTKGIVTVNDAVFQGSPITLRQFQGLVILTNPMTTVGDLIEGGISGAPVRLGVGTDSQVLTMNGGIPSWQNSTGMLNPMTSRGDLIIGQSGGAPIRLSIGTNSQVLTVSAGSERWADPTGGFANPMTNAEDLIKGGASGTPVRLGAGSDGNVLQVSGGVVQWLPKPGPNVAYSAILQSPGDSTVSNSLADFSGLGVTVVVPSSNYLISFSVNFGNTTANVTVKFAVLVDGVNLGTWQVQGPVATGLLATTIHQDVLATLVSAGSHVFKLQWSTTGGTVQAGTNLTSTLTPCVLIITQTI